MNAIEMIGITKIFPGVIANDLRMDIGSFSESPASSATDPRRTRFTEKEEGDPPGARTRPKSGAAADTFRAAAIDQLKIHGERLDVRVVAHKHGGDPAAVIYDAIEAARAAGSDLIIADTAGRMHTKSGLVEELRKIDRIVAAKADGAVYRKLLVVDATTGSRSNVISTSIMNLRKGR